MKKVEYIKKPSTNHSEYPYKFHYFIPVDNISQNYDEYKLQYYKFLAEHDIDLSDKSLASVVQNSNPFKGDKEEAKSLTYYNKRKKMGCTQSGCPEEKKKVKEKHSDTSKDDVKKDAVQS